jgi:putative peptide zinc metalloprotease protein
MNTTTPALPRMNPLVRIGPEEIVNGKPIRFAKHQPSGLYFRIGEREALVLERLDGCHSREQIGAAYQAAFGHPLLDGSWNNLMQLFTERGLLEGTTPASAASGVRTEPEENALNFRFFFWNPDRLMGRIAPYFRWLVNAPAMCLWAGLVLLAELAIAPHWPQLWDEALRFNGLTVLLRALLLVAIYALVTVVHETGHAVACKRYGGEVREMGVLLRYFIFTAYTKVDDILLFHRRSWRVQVLAIGPLINLSVLPPALLLWYWAPPDSVARMVAVDLLVWFHIGSLLQLLPFLQSDGYFIFAQWLKMPELRKDASAYLAGRTLAWLSGRRLAPMSPRCARFAVPVYVVYGLAAFGVTGAAVAYVLHRYASSLQHWLGNSAGYAVAAALGLLLAWRVAFQLIPWLKLQHSKLLPA